ncbi:helix-turn-helix transcriptional regulator [Ruegeria arenilitoris]|uniref:helix-turn-helix transcriptional regulator n=1 Tax=Ruegeria arenilitoris TaxID=1173585 RepID=UPI00147A44C8|nr:AlpA family phage regulatory protein [Ruegeria arenilitoris]
MPREFVPIRTMMAEAHLSRASVYKLSKEGKLPPLVKLHAHCTGVWREDWDHWLDTRPTVHAGREDAA